MLCRGGDGFALQRRLPTAAVRRSLSISERECYLQIQYQHIWHKWNRGCDLAFWHVCLKSYENVWIYEQQQERLSPRMSCFTSCSNLLHLGVRMRRIAYCETSSIQSCAHNLRLPSWNLCAGPLMCYDCKHWDACHLT